MTREEIIKSCLVYDGKKSFSKDDVRYSSWEYEKECVDWLVEAQERSLTELDWNVINESYRCSKVGIALLLMIALIRFPELPLSFRKKMPFFNGMAETDGIIGFDKLPDKEWNAHRKASSSFKEFEQFVRQSRN